MILRKKTQPQPEDTAKKKGVAELLVSSPELDSSEEVDVNRDHSKLPFVLTISVGEEGIDPFKQCTEVLSDDASLALVVFAEPGLKIDLIKDQIEASSSFNITTVDQSTRLEAKHVYLVPPSKYLKLDGGELSLLEQPDRSISPLDAFLASVVSVEKKRAIVLLFTPWITPYIEGLKELRQQHGLALRLNYPNISSSPETPLLPILIDASLPALKIAERVNAYTVATQQSQATGLSLQQEDIQSLEKIYATLNRTTGIRCSDFDLIFILEHIQQRLNVHGTSSITTYANLINSDPSEVWLLARRMALNISGFFYERSILKMVAQDIIPDLLEQHGNDVVRAWVPACSTGEEVLSLAILFDDFATNLPQSPKIQVIGTEADETVVQIARKAEFAQNSLHMVPQGFKETYFDAQHDRYVFNRQLLQQVHFAQLEPSATPPYANINLIYYRGRLNKLKKEVQAKVLKNLHHALDTNGYLVIGQDDHIGAEISLFTPIDDKGTVFKPVSQKKKTTQSAHTVNLFRKEATPFFIDAGSHQSSTPVGQLHRDLLLQIQNTVSVLMKPDFSIVDQCGNVGMYVAWPNNGKTANLLKAFPEEVRDDLKEAVQQAIIHQKALKSKVIGNNRKGVLKPFKLHVRPIELPGKSQSLLQIVFIEDDSSAGEPGLTTSLKGQSLNAIVNKLEADLRHSKDRLNTLTRQLEETRASQNLEPQTQPLQPKIFEKLQTQNSELKTTNKELLALNRDLVRRVEELRKRTHEIQKEQELKQSQAPPSPAGDAIDGAVSALLSKQILKLTTSRHEIRTALTSIMGFADLLSDRMVDSDNKELARYISKAGNKLSDSLAELLEGDFEDYEVFESPAEEEPVIDDALFSDRVLVVEDSDATRRLLSLVLSDRFECELAADANEAIEKAEKEHFKAVLMDINLGTGQSGLDVLAHLRQKSPYREVPFMAVTAMASPQDESLLRRKGFNAYLAKPFQKATLLSTLDEMLAENGSF